MFKKIVYLVGSLVLGIGALLAAAEEGSSRAELER